MKKIILSLFSILPLLLFSQVKLIKSPEFPLKKNERIVSTITTTEKQVYIITVVSSTYSVNNYSPSDKITFYHFGADLNLIDQKPLKKLKYQDVDFNFSRAFLFGEKIMLQGKAVGQNMTYFVMTELDKTTLLPSGNFVDFFQREYHPDITHPELSELHLRFSPSGNYLAVDIIFDTEALSTANRTISFEHHFLTVNASGTVSKKLKRKGNSSDFDFDINDFAVTNNGEFFILETKNEHIDILQNGKFSEASLKRFIQRKKNLELLHFSGDASNFQLTDILSPIQNADFIHPFLFQANTRIFLAGLYRLFIPMDSTSDINAYFFATELQPTSQTFKIDRKKATVINRELYVELFEANLSSDDKKVSETRTNFGFSFGSVDQNGNITVAGEVYVDRSWPPYETMKNDSRYTIHDNGYGYSISGPSDYSRTFNQVFIIQINPSTSKFTGKIAGRNYKIPQEVRLIQKGGPLAAQFVPAADSTNAAFAFVDSNASGIKISFSDWNGQNNDAEFDLPADYKIVFAENHDQKTMASFGKKSFFLLRYE